MIRVLFLLLGVMIPLFAISGPIEEGYTKFQDGDLKGAIEVWEGVLEKEAGSATLHYNLGSALYRSGDVPKAIAHWRLGRVLSPRDANVVHNLAVARSELSDVIEPVDTQPPLLQVATAMEWGLTGCLLLLVASLGLWLAPLRRRLGPWPAVGIAVIGALLMWVSLSGASRLSQQPGAVVKSDGAFLRSLATRRSDVVSRLLGGTELGVEGSHDGFVLVRTSGQVRGWIPMDAVFFVGQDWNQPPVN